MVTIHGSFVPAGATGLFFLWGLDPEAETPPARRGRAVPVHPRAVAPEALFPALRGVPYLSALTLVQWQPDCDGPRPAKLPGVALSLPNAVQWLLDLAQHFEGTSVQPGHSLRMWSTAAKLLLELLGRGRMLPVLRVDAGVLAAGWSLHLADPEDARRLTRLAAGLPEACRTLVPPDRDHRTYALPDPEALLHQFMRTSAAGVVHLLLEGVPLPEAQSLQDTALRHWLAALAGAAPRDLPPGLPGEQALFTALDRWSAPASGVLGHAALRSGLRLNPPGPETEGDWELELTLHAPEEDALPLSADAVWANLGQEVEIGGQRYQGAEQRLLADLPAMARLFPPLAPLLQASAPSRLPIAAEDVIALIQEGALLLQQAGHPVLLPAALVKPARLRVGMRLSPAGAGPSLFGLHQIVDVRWDVALGDAELTLDELHHLARQKRPLVQMQGQWVRVDERALAAVLRRIEQHGKQVELGTALRLAPEVDETTATGWIADLLTKLREPARVEPVPTPKGFVGTLRPYQERGLAWLAFLRRFGLGACLADDMGLGKTIQLIALLLHERESGLAAGPTLLVCPVSVLGNWRRELARFAPGLRVMVHHGAGRLAGDEFAREAAMNDVVLTTYSLVAREADLLRQVAWNGVVADEAQNLKNPATLHARALHGLNGGYRVALTGTPIENHLGDLWSLFQFLNPGLLGSYEEFQRRYALPIQRFQDEEATERLRRQVGPFILRRQKDDPAIAPDLPEKLESTELVNLSVEQAALYEAIVQETLERASQTEGIQRHGAVLAGLTRLKQVCNHPAAIHADGPLTGRSGKIDRLVEMLEEVLAAGEQALLFTQFARFGSRLQAYLADRLGCTVLFLHGGTPQPERERLIARFQGGEAPLFLLSLKAGGLGLNLTAATHVFHVDRWWNPAVEDQATDRAYRIGQTRRVLVHRLVTVGTLEERIDRLLAEKRALSAQVIGGGEAWLGNLSTEELRALITLEREV